MVGHDFIVPDKSQELFDSLWGMAPEGILTYMYDEPMHYDNGFHCAPCQTEYTKRYGGEAPKDIKDKTSPGYYRYARILDGAMSDALMRKGKLWRETKSRMKLFGLQNEGGCLHESALFMARAFDGFGCDIWSGGPGKWRVRA